MKIKLEAINDVKDFSNLISKCPINATLKSGRYVVDAKSIMGIFSLDLSKTLQLDLEEDHVSEEFFKELKRFEVDV